MSSKNISLQISEKNDDVDLNLNDNEENMDTDEEQNNETDIEEDGEIETEDEGMDVDNDDDEDDDENIVINEDDLADDTDAEDDEEQEENKLKNNKISVSNITINDMIKSTEDDIELLNDDEDEENVEDTEGEDIMSSDDESVDLNSRELLYSKNQLYNKHFTCKEINYKELNALSKVVKKKKVIVDDMHKTLPILTRFEKARILGLRAKQLNDGSEPLYEVPPNIINSFDIAEEELNRKLLPFIIKRPIGDYCEYWKLSDLKII